MTDAFGNELKLFVRKQRWFGWEIVEQVCKMFVFWRTLGLGRRVFDTLHLFFRGPANREQFGTPFLEKTVAVFLRSPGFVVG